MNIKGHPCPTCKKEREYGSKQGAKKSKGRNCRACSNSFQLGGPGMAFNKAGEQLCNDCRERPKKFNSLCNECAVKRRKEYYRSKLRFDRYGVTEEWFDERFTGFCEICEDPIDKFSCHIDHCHTSGEVRGLLCSLCNKGLGQFRDNVESLKKAIHYLERNK